MNGGRRKAIVRDLREKGVRLTKRRVRREKKNYKLRKRYGHVIDFDKG